MCWMRNRETIKGEVIASMRNIYECQNVERSPKADTSEKQSYGPKEAKRLMLVCCAAPVYCVKDFWGMDAVSERRSIRM